MYPQRSVMTCGLATALEPPHFNHAPVRGATGASFSLRSRAGSFNPRTRVGCDSLMCCGSRSWSLFQSTHPRGVRQTRGGRLWAPRRWFQSTHPRGVRPASGASVKSRLPVSIHAPAWGATRHRRPAVRRHTSGFNPRTRVGCDLIYLASAVGAVRFQSTHPRGVRLFPCFIQ